MSSAAILRQILPDQEIGAETAILRRADHRAYAREIRGAAHRRHTWPVETKPPVTFPDREAFIAEMGEFGLERAASGDAGAGKMLPLFEPWATEQIGKRPNS